MPNECNRSITRTPPYASSDDTLSFPMSYHLRSAKRQSNTSGRSALLSPVATVRVETVRESDNRAVVTATHQNKFASWKATPEGVQVVPDNVILDIVTERDLRCGCELAIGIIAVSLLDNNGPLCSGEGLAVHSAVGIEMPWALLAITGAPEADFEWAEVVDNCIAKCIAGAIF
jgi:hypothetical protein